MLRTSPFHRIIALTAALAMASTQLRAAPLNSQDRLPLVKRYDDALQKLQEYTSRGKGGKRPRHPSKRFVAQDKRDARKARNRRRA